MGNFVNYWLIIYQIKIFQFIFVKKKKKIIKI